MNRAGRQLALVALVVIAGCGGGGGGDTGTAAPPPTTAAQASSGQAAVGAAMANAALKFTSLADGTSAQGTADALGLFTVPAELQAPVLVQATSANGAYILFGYLREHGQHVAVNPITTTLITLAAGRHPAGVTAPLPADGLAAGRQAVATAFGAVLAATQVPATTDFLAARFSTDHTGLDLVLDSIGVQLGADGAVLLANKISGERRTLTASSVVPLPFDAAAVAQMESLPIAQCAGTVDGMSSETLAADASAYDPAFLDSGRSLPTFMGLMATAAGASAYRLAMPVFSGVDANGNMVFSAMRINAATGKYIADMALAVNRNAQGRCVIMGNRYPFNVSVQPAIRQLVRLDGLTGLANHEVVPAVNGLEIQVGAPDAGSAVNTTTGAPGGDAILSARVDVCGPSGTCVNLATLRSQMKPTNKGTFRIDGSPYDFMDVMPVPAVDLHPGTRNPIRISFFSSTTAPSDPLDDTGRVGPRLYAKVPGPAFSASEFAAIALPTARNASYLQSFNDRPAVEYDAGTGVLNTAGFLGQAPGQPLKSAQVLVLQPGSGTVTAPASVDYDNAFYRSLTLTSRIPSRAGVIVTKYLWSPGNPGSY